MVFDIFIILALIAITIASYTDIKTREVPDWLNYALIAVGLGVNLIYSVIYWDYTYILRSAIGLAAAVLLGMVMFYTGQWGGGDSKMVFGLGALLGLSYPFKLDFFAKFLVNMLFAGALYVMVWAIISGIKNRAKVIKKFKKILENDKLRKIRYYSAILIVLGLILIYFIDLDSSLKIIFVFMSIFLYSANYFILIIKSIEEAVMIKSIEPEKLTEGDWIVKDIKAEGKYITGPKELGIKKDQIKMLLKLKQQGKLKKIIVKYGIPFIPSFLMAIIYTILTDSIVLLSFI